MLPLSVAFGVAVPPPRSPTKEVAPGVHMPVLSLGTCCGSNPSVGVVPWLTNSGVGIDTAWDYFDQKAVGQGILKSGVNRSSVFVLTKVPPVVDALAKVKDDLQQLGLTQADLILLHNPTTKASNAKLYAELEQALEQGLTRAIGISDFSKQQVVDLLEAAKVVYSQHDPAKDKPIELEISWVCDESNKCHQLVPPELHAEAEAAAKAFREAMDDD